MLMISSHAKTNTAQGGVLRCYKTLRRGCRRAVLGPRDISQTVAVKPSKKEKHAQIFDEVSTALDLQGMQ